MDTEIAVVLVHPLQGGQVGGVGDNLVDPLAGSNGGVSNVHSSSRSWFMVRSSEILEMVLVVELSDVNFSFYSHASGPPFSLSLPCLFANIVDCCISNDPMKVVFDCCCPLFYPAFVLRDCDERNKFCITDLFLPLVLLHDGGALVVLNLGVRVYTDNQVVAHSLGLTKSVEVTYISVKEEQVGPRWLDDDELWLPFFA